MCLILTMDDEEAELYLSDGAAARNQNLPTAKRSKRALASHCSGSSQNFKYLGGVDPAAGQGRTSDGDRVAKRFGGVAEQPLRLVLLLRNEANRAFVGPQFQKNVAAR